MHPSDYVDRFPDKPAQIMASSGEVMTFRELDHLSNQAAHMFRRIGLQVGDAIAICMVNSPRFLEIAWAAQRSGLYYTCVSSRLAAPEITYIATNSGAKAIFVSHDLAALLPELKAALPDVRFFAEGGPIDGADSYEAARDACPTTPIADQRPGLEMLYSSGTTGNPKGIRRALPDGPFNVEDPLEPLARNLYGMDESTVYLSPAPLYHSAPLGWSMAAHRLGGTVIIMEKFDAEQALALIEKYKVTHAQWVPTHFLRMLRLPAEIRAKYDLSSLKAVFHAAAPCPVEVKQAMLDWWGPIIHEYYSGTERPGFTAIGPKEWLERPGSVGRAVLGIIRICGEDGEEVGARQEGLVCFEGHATFEYFNDPVKTAEAYGRKGWPSMGDVGWVDEDGYLFLTDRKSFMIISGGVNIYPQEIENAIIGHQGVLDVAVIGAPDEEMGERLVAVVQPVDINGDLDELAEDIRKSLRGKIGSIKIPKQIDFVEDFPRHPNGKLFKRLLRDRYRDKASAA